MTPWKAIARWARVPRPTYQAGGTDPLNPFGPDWTKLIADAGRPGPEGFNSLVGLAQLADAAFLSQALEGAAAISDPSARVLADALIIKGSPLTPKQWENRGLALAHEWRRQHPWASSRASGLGILREGTARQ